MDDFNVFWIVQMVANPGTNISCKFVSIPFYALQTQPIFEYPTYMKSIIIKLSKLSLQ